MAITLQPTQFIIIKLIDMFSLTYIAKTCETSWSLDCFRGPLIGFFAHIGFFDSILSIVSVLFGSVSRRRPAFDASVFPVNEN